MGATGESPRRVTDFGFSPAWSPDGRRLAVTTEWTYDPMWQTGSSELWVVNLASGETRRILEGNASSPSWSPDGRWIAYYAYTEGLHRDVWIVLAGESDTTAKPVRVTSDPGGAWNPQWSPDGRFLYFLSGRVGVPNLWRVSFDAATGTPGDNPESVMLPLAPRYVSLDRRGHRLALEIEGRQSSLQRLDIDPASGDTRGRPTAILDSASIFQQVTISPDGRWIAGGLHVDRDLFVVRADGTGFRRLTQDLDDDQTPAWRPDGSGLVFSSDRGGGFALWSINLDGSGLRQLTPEGTDCAAWPVWSPDGRFVVSGQSKTCLWRRLPSGELELAEVLPAPSDGRVFFASWWSPDGRNVMGIAMPEGGGYSSEAVSFDIETREFRRLPDLDGLYSCMPLRDGRRAVCRAGAEGEIVVADLQSGARTVLLGKAEVTDLEYWSAAPSREWLCLLRQYQLREMYLVELE
jgi:Tol biopolymer transport system component